MALVDRAAQWPEQWRSEGRVKCLRKLFAEFLQRIDQRAQREPAPAVDKARDEFLDLVAELPEDSRREGWADGTRYTLFVVTEERFGADVAFRVRGLLSSTDDPSRLGDVTRWIMNCQTEHELIDGVSAICDC